MKKIIILIMLFITYSVSVNAQVTTACCPEFVLKFKKDLDCLKTGTCASANGESNFTASMCKYSTNTFIVTPNLPGYSYVWTVTGGTISYPAFPATNPATITWGGNGSGTITVVITSADGKCKKTIKETVCLRDAPQAKFTFTPNNACAGTLINFTNTSIGGAAVSWNFGDGTFAGNVNNPTHTYAASGTYNVTITVYSDTADCIPSTPNPVGIPGRACCGCISTYTLPVTVIAGKPLSIVPKECINQCLCAGDTAEYCATKICAPYNWSVSGGTIISGAGTSCIKIKWTGPYPTSIQLIQPGCGNPCNDTSRLSVPVLVSGIPIMPNVSPVCQFSTQTYYLPAMPGAFYNWSVTGGMIVGPNQNTSSIVVNWTGGPTGQVNCTYNNPLKPGCDGTTNLPVNIKPVLKINGPNQTCEGCPPITLFTGGATPVSWSATGGAVCTPPVGTSTSVSFPVTGVISTYTITAASGAFCNSPQTTTVVVAPKPVLTITPSTIQTCPGTPVKFVATSTVTTTPITWVLPAGASMIANTGPQMDTAVIQFSTIPVGGATVTAEQYCSFNLSCSKGTASATVTKPPVPIITPSVSNPCIDETVNYVVSNAVPGVVYTWVISSTLGTITSGQGTSSVNILWHGGSPNTATLTVSNCAGTSVAVPITVTMPFFPTISTSGTCIKTGITLTSSTGGPYLWNTGATTASITVYTAGTYCVTINPAALGSCKQQKCITIPPNPYWVKIIPPCSVSSCNPASLSVLLTVQTNIGSPTGCQWMFDPAGGPVIFSPVSISCGNYTATLLGSYYLIMTDANGCKDTSNIIRIPQDINICCATAACSALSGINFNFTHTGCAPTTFTGTPLTLPSGWTTGTLHPTICYGDGTSDDFVSLNTIHQYPAAGLYTACVVQKVVKPGAPVNDTCCISTCQNVDIPVVAHFNASYNCLTGKLTMTDASSLYLAGATTYTWGVSGGTYTGALTNTPTVVITPTSSGTFVITLTVIHRGCSSTAPGISVVVVLPNCNITALPNPSCDGAPVSFSTTAGLVLHNWQFGDGKFSYAATTQHTYAGPGTYNVVLTASTPDGCPVICSLKVVIQPKPIVTITPKNVTVCPNTPVTLTANINLNGNTMCSSYNLQWYNNGAAYGAPVPVSSFPVNLTVNSYGNFYAVLTGSNLGCNCVITTDTILIKWFPKPIAKIKGKSAVCLVGGVGTLNVENTVSSYPTYNWSSNNPGNISFSPTNVYNPAVTITAAGNFQIFLEVIDANGCKAYDTLCIYSTNSPTAFITPPGGTLCAGNTYSLTATPSPLTAPPAGYAYLWNNTATTNTINATAAGVYYAFVTDLNTGCSAATNSIVINKGPDLSLFPSCCDTICSNAPINISVPLPLAPGDNICTKYTIVWLDNNVPISPQPSPCNILNTASLVPLLGMHNLSIIVTLNGCTDTSNVFNLYIKNCDSIPKDCCKDSHWKEEPYYYFKNNENTEHIKIDCKNTVILITGDDCKKPLIVGAAIQCPKDCVGTDSVFVYNNLNNVVLSGPAPLSIIGLPNGSYTVVVNGYCGGKLCITCKFTIKVDCKDCECGKNEPLQLQLTINGKIKKIECGADLGKLNCKDNIVLDGSYTCNPKDCPAQLTYTLNGPGGVVTGTLPLILSSLTPGSYSIVIQAYCNGKLCKECKLTFIIECDKPCCPYTITAQSSQPTYVPNANATIVTNNFTITGIPATATITEVRANVISYTIDDNYKGDCMKCVNLPFTWASASTATNIATAPPKITMFGGVTVPSFNGSGAGAYQNPREIIWNNGSNLNIPITSIGISFILPPTLAIDCCELKGKICVKFTFRDEKCNECEAIGCFNFVIKKK